MKTPKAEVLMWAYLARRQLLAYIFAKVLQSKTPTQKAWVVRSWALGCIQAVLVFDHEGMCRNDQNLE